MSPSTNIPNMAECNLGFVNRDVSDLLLVPIPRDEKLNESAGSGSGRERRSTKEKASKEISLAPYRNRFRVVSITPNIETKLKFIVPFSPSQPPNDSKFLHQCLENNERYTKWNPENWIQDIVRDKYKNKKMSEISDRDVIGTFGNYIKEKFRYNKERDVYQRVDDLLLSPKYDHPNQDCLGYHAALVGCARSWGIPAVLDIGFRLSGQDDPHTWTWYYDRQKSEWVGVDLNDNKDHVVFGFYGRGRVSMTLGTTHIIQGVPDFPNSIVSFVQYGLGKNRIENHPPFTSARFSIIKTK